MKVNNVLNNTNINRQMSQRVTFSKNNNSYDRVELQPKNKELSTRTKIVIGAGIITAIGLGVEVLKYKGKHFKTLTEKIRGKGNNNKTDNIKKPDLENIRKIPDFKNITEAKEYFERIGIKTIFKPGAENHLEDLNSFKTQFAVMEQNGVAIPKPDCLIIGNWHNQSEMREIFNSLNLKDKSAILDEIGLWGTVERGNDGKLYVIINSNFGNFKDITHEMGHLHQDLEKSFWNNKGFRGKDFMNKQLEILGMPNTKINPIMADSFYRRDELPSILRYPCFRSDSQENVAIMKQLFPDLEKRDIFKVFSFSTQDGKKYAVNAKKLIDKMQTETNTYQIKYSDTYTWEQAATMFSRLNDGREFSDEVLLMYDFIGGGRVPNLVIKGKKYDDYIESLYNNDDLVHKLRESIEIKQFEN